MGLLNHAKNTPPVGQWIPVGRPGRSIASAAALIPPAPNSAVHPPPSKPSKPRRAAWALPQRTQRMAASASASDASCTKGCGNAMCSNMSRCCAKITRSVDQICVLIVEPVWTACSTVGFQKYSKIALSLKSLAWAQQKHGTANPWYFSNSWTSRMSPTSMCFETSSWLAVSPADFTIPLFHWAELTNHDSCQRPRCLFPQDCISNSVLLCTLWKPEHGWTWHIAAQCCSQFEGLATDTRCACGLAVGFLRFGSKAPTSNFEPSHWLCTNVQEVEPSRTHYAHLFSFCFQLLRAQWQKQNHTNTFCVCHGKKWSRARPPKGQLCKHDKSHSVVCNLPPGANLGPRQTLQAMRIASHFAHCKNSAGGNDCFPKQQALTVAGVWVAHRVGTSNTMQFQFHHHQMASSRVKKQQLHTHTHLYYTYLKHLETAKYSRCYKEDNVERIQQISLKGDSRRTLSIWVLSARKPSTSMGRLPTKSCMELSFTRGRTTRSLA